MLLHHLINEVDMKSKPILYKGLTIFNLLIIIGLPLQIALLYEHNVSEFLYIIDKMTIFNWIVALSCAMVALSSHFAHKSLKWLIPISATCVFMNNLIVARYGDDYTAETVFFSTMVFLLIQFSFFALRDSKLIAQQDKRWWLIPKRHKIKANVWISVNDKKEYLGTTFDISRTGLFLKYDEKKTNEILAQLHQGDDIKITIDLETPIECEAKVVRKSLATGIYPAGMGMRFNHLGGLNSLRLGYAFATNH